MYLNYFIFSIVDNNINDIDIEIVTLALSSTDKFKNNFVKTSLIVTIYYLFCAYDKVVTDNKASIIGNVNSKERKVEIFD